MLLRAPILFLLPLALAFVVERDAQVDKAISMLKGLPLASRFCSSLIYSNGPTTKTATVTAKETAGECSTKTEVMVEKATLTQTKTITLPIVTRFVYSTTVFVAGNHTPAVRKRDPFPSPAGLKRRAIPTPAVVANFLPPILSQVCSSLFPAPTTTITTTSTATRTKCTIMTTSTRTRYIAITTTSITAFPPPAIVSRTGTLTTIVPSACLAVPLAPTQAIPLSLTVSAATYPLFPDSLEACCALCYQQGQRNCVGAAYISGGGDCQFLLNQEVQGPGGKSGQCPLGLAAFDFGPEDVEANVLLGPCNR